MHSKLIRLITLFVILVCLPLQGLAAVAMPACQAQHQNMEMHNAGQAGVMSHCGHCHDDGQPSKSAACDQCFTCHLSAAQAIIPFSLPMAIKGVAPMVAAPLAGTSDSLPSSLFRPPRLTLA